MVLVSTPPDLVLLCRTVGVGSTLTVGVFLHLSTQAFDSLPVTHLECAMALERPWSRLPCVLGTQLVEETCESGLPLWNVTLFNIEGSARSLAVADREGGGHPWMRRECCAV